MHSRTDSPTRILNLRLAIPVFEELAALNEDGEYRLRLDAARALLAQASSSPPSGIAR